jgi:hypothetical protein
MDNPIILAIVFAVLFLLAGITWLLFRKKQSRRANLFFGEVMDWINHLADYIRNRTRI